MKRLLYLIYFLAFIIQSNAQSRWEDHFSYKEVKEIHQINNKLYCVSSNALFSYDLESGELEKISKVNLLNGVKPSSAAYNSELDYLLIGYENGELDILGEESENFIEIPLDDYTGSKRINHIATAGNLMLISADYGISIFDLDRREFAETTFFREGGIYKKVDESAIFNNKVYAIYDGMVVYHEIDDLIPNFNRWTKVEDIYNSTFEHIEVFNDQLVASSGGSLFVLKGNTWVFKKALGTTIVDLNTNQNRLIASIVDRVFVLDENIEVEQAAGFENEIKSGILSNEMIYAGTTENGLVINGGTSTERGIYPDGPYSNNAYAVTATAGHIWVSPGGQDNYNSPTGNKEGYFHFNNEDNEKKWIHITSKQLNNAQDIIDVAYNPSDLNQVYASSWHYSYNLYEILNDEKVIEYDYQNTGNNGIVQNFYNHGQVTNLGGAVFDSEGNLYISQAFVDPNKGYSALIKRNTNNQWSNILFENYHPGASGITKPVIGRNGYIWLGGTRGDGVIVTNMTNTYQILEGEGKGDLPSNFVYALEIDKNGTAWIGTNLGLRILRNPIAELESGNFNTEPVVIVQNGIPEALLTDTNITDITVDSSNRKWIATRGAGVFYVSESGKEIIYHFTEDLSPLASNTINAVAVDTETGVVYFATENGLVSYKGDAVDTGDDFGEVVAYPNPVRPGYDGNITIKGLAKDTEVLITDVVGNLIHKGEEAGGVILWDQTNLKGQKVASGIYIVMLISGDGMHTKTTKIAIVR
ncbi:T9SS type A sorting domain-containing protein [Flavobacteriaceae bacterium Ap0902]|nr:T9SS type A sorting domain-containing protein [Flavobacteriaceae bacterium Ap0902]